MNLLGRFIFMLDIFMNLDYAMNVSNIFDYTMYLLITYAFVLDPVIYILDYAVNLLIADILDFVVSLIDLVNFDSSIMNILGEAILRHELLDY